MNCASKKRFSFGAESEFFHTISKNECGNFFSHTQLTNGLLHWRKKKSRGKFEQLRDENIMQSDTLSKKIRYLPVLYVRHSL